MAKPAAAGGPAAPEKKGKKKTFKKKERKHVSHGIAHIQASFNNTIVTIADQAWDSADPARERHLPPNRPHRTPQ
jgi:predicted double-glycine peptidase